MNFISISFYLSLLLLFFINYLVKSKYRIYILLIYSLFFYGINNINFLPFILCFAVIIYLGGLCLQKWNHKTNYVILFIITLIPLFIYKYLDFGISIINRIFITYDANISLLNLTLPLGISFFTFQAINYIGDIYHQRLIAEKNILKVYLYLIFFPTLVSGPIQKARYLLPQFNEKSEFNYDLVKHGFCLISFGLLQKFLISDRLFNILNPMINNIGIFSGFHIIFFACMYSLYIYANFNSYSDIAIGIGEILGFRFQSNFRRPYLSTTVKEFWQRWHISLNKWFIEYVYIPLGGSRTTKINKFRNIMTVFLLSGLWHGAAFHFIFWGALNGLYQILGDLTKSIRAQIYKKLYIDQNSVCIQWLKRGIVFYLISIAWIFFAIPSTKLSLKAIISMLLPNISTLFDNVILDFLGTKEQVISLIFCLIVFLYIQYKREYKSIFKIFSNQNIIFRFIVYLITVVIIIFCLSSTYTGYGNGGFIYGNF